MRKRFAWLCAMALAAGSANAGNILTNGDLENGLTGWADTLWRYNGGSDVAGTLALDSSDVHGGSKALKVTVTQVNSSANWHLRLYMPSFKATKGNTYNLSFYAKSDAASSFSIGMDTGAAHGYAGSAGASTSTSWKQYTAKMVASSTGEDYVAFNIYLSSTGTFHFDDFNVEEEAALSLRDDMTLPTKGAWYTGKYRNLFAERGYDSATVWNHLQTAYNQLFFSTDTAAQSIYRTVPDDTTMAFIQASDVSNAENSDIRTEGQSYGMIISVMMDRQDVFNKLWKFAKTYEQHQSDSTGLRGLFRWALHTYAPYAYRGTYGYTPAPDGEEYFVTALYLAAKRWGSGEGWYNYQEQADSLLTYMMTARSGMTMLDPDAKQILFSVTNGGTRYTDPSYHLPAFYRMWGAFAGHDNDFFKAMADTSVAFWKRASDSTTGLSTDYANLDGSPHLNGYSSFTFNGATYAADTVYYSDSHRTIMNIAVDWAWFMPDEWEMTQCRRQLGFFYGQGGAASYKQDYTRSGTALSSYSASQSQMGANGAGVLASDTARDWAFVDALYNASVPSGNYRYYNGLVYLLGYLHTSGYFKAYGSPGLTGSSAIHAGRNVAAATLNASVHGRTVSLSGLPGGSVRLLDACGREAAEARVSAGRAELKAPTRGLWFVAADGISRPVMIP